MPISQRTDADTCQRMEQSQRTHQWRKDHLAHIPSGPAHIKVILVRQCCTVNMRLSSVSIYSWYWMV